MAKGLKPGQVPDWRPGAIFWKPLADGREVTIYPLLFNAARLCVGPLAEQFGYDVAYFYESHAAAIKAAEDWDGESSQHPEGFVKIERGADHQERGREDHGAGIPNVGQMVAPKPGDTLSLERKEYPPDRMTIERDLGDGRKCLIEGIHRMDVDGTAHCEVQNVTVEGLHSADSPAQACPICGGRGRSLREAPVYAVCEKCHRTFATGTA